jgi:hypothetical protein
VIRLVGRRPLTCRLVPLHAVYVSNLHRSLKDIALAHAWFADDDGSNIYPAVETVASMVGCDPKTIRHGRRVLEHLGILVQVEGSRATGGRGKATKYRIDYAVLAALKPGHPRPRIYEKKPGPPRPGIDRETRAPAPVIADENPGAQHHKGGRSTAERRALSTETRAPAPADPIDPTGTVRKQTGADAPARVEAGVIEPPPFKVYAAIATAALNESIREDKTDDIGNVTERFKVTCARQGLPYNAEVARKAVDAAIHARSKAAGDFLSAYRTVIQGRSSAAPVRREVCG